MLKQQADSIIMLTWSNWHTELRSNRYHYATRFAKELPVIFVQPDLSRPEYTIEKTNDGNLTILHVYRKYDETQIELLNKALIELNILRPIFWIYNVYFYKFIASRYSLLNIYHGTEDYLSSDSRIKFKDNELINSCNNLLAKCDLLISVSDGVRKSFEESSVFSGRSVVVANGCDYKFYCPQPSNSNQLPPVENNTVLYQGSIFDKIDYDLMHQLAQSMPDWTFKFCGKVLFNEAGWRKLCKLPNVIYLGLLSPEQIKNESHKATVGIIPFVQSEWLVERSFPLKTFEYLASGLPVVSIPIKAIADYSDVVLFASDAHEFKEAIQKAAIQRFDSEHSKARLQVASQQDYDLRFQQAKKEIICSLQQSQAHKKTLNVVVLYEPSSIEVPTISEHLNSFSLYSQHNVVYLPATNDLTCHANLNDFDVVIIHYSVRVSVPHGSLMLSNSYIESVKGFGGIKILFLQDEYEGTEYARQWISNLGIHTVYTCVPRDAIEQIYPQSRFPSVKFINTLTGYVPSEAENLSLKYKNTKRKVLIGYRGRALPYWYGSLGHEKLMIGVKVKEYCTAHNLPVDIEWDNSKRIYGAGWYEFLAGCRATLGTESGSNIFDEDGSIAKTVHALLQKKPDLSYEEVYEQYLSSQETIKMNQISPKIFEAIALRTALVLFEGTYSNIIQPDIHYIPLKKDFSNIKDVISKIQDDIYLDKITENAFRDIIESKQYSYQSFIESIDLYLSQNIQNLNNHSKITYTTVGFVDDGTRDKSHSTIIYTTVGSRDNKALPIYPLTAQGTTLPSRDIFNLQQIQSFEQSRDETIQSISIQILKENSFLKNCNLLTRVYIIKSARGILKLMPIFLKNFLKKCMPNVVKRKIKITFERVSTN